MWQSYLALYKYWVTPSGYLRLATTVVLDMGITDGKLLFCRGISEGSVYNKISTIECINRTVYDCLNNPLSADCGIPALNIYPITIDDRPLPHKRSRYTPDLLPAAISVASRNHVSTLIAHSYLPRLILLPSDDPNPPRAMKICEPYHGRLKIGYFYRKHDEKYATKRQSSIAPRALIKIRNFITVMIFQVLIQRGGLASWNINIV